jgi:hypothetical protein
MEYRRFVRVFQDMYDEMKANETRRWGHGTAANALEQSLLTQTSLLWDGGDLPKEFGLQSSLKDFLELNEPVSIKENLGDLATALMQAAAYKKQLKVMGSHMKQAKLPCAIAAILDRRGRTELHKIITQHLSGGTSLLGAWKHESAAQTSAVCELQSWRHDCRQFSVGPLPYCAPEARLFRGGGEIIMGVCVENLPGNSLKAQISFLHGLTFTRALEAARRGGMLQIMNRIITQQLILCFVRMHLTCTASIPI